MIHSVIPKVRLEVKYVTDESHLHFFLYWLQLQQQAFVERYPRQQVNSVYFDNQNYASYLDNISGISARSKVRFRWYGDQLVMAPGVLEIKIKRNNFGWKQRYEVANSVHGKSSKWNQVILNLKSQLPREACMYLDTKPLPTVLISYERRYFESIDGKVRSTIDTRQMIYDQRWNVYPSFLHPTRCFSTLVIIEFKFHPCERDRVMRMLKTIPFRYSKYSKYVRSLQAIGL